MNIENAVSQINNISFAPNITKPVDKAVTGSFESFYQAAIDMINETNEYQKAAESAQIDFATGKSDDVLSLMLSMDKAYTSLNFTVQVTNKIIEAYREIMRIQL